jgi:oligopeptide/dipeptide ABC transporter ATP-binding protein
MSIPRAVDEQQPSGSPAALLEVSHLKHYFPVKRGVLVDRVVAQVQAVDDVSFTLAERETLGLVGESGCGKSTLARVLLGLLTPTAGTVRFRGEQAQFTGRGARDLRREIQMVFQDPQGSLNPRKRVGQIVATGLRLRGVPHKDAESRVRLLLSQVGLNPEHINRFPHEFSGGQRQRIGVARALAVRPSLIVLDEPVSALDVSIRAQVINLLADLQREFEIAYLFVAHDLAVVRHVSNRIAVMYLGKLVEISPSDELYYKPVHPYTATLLSAVPIPDVRQERKVLAVSGEPPTALKPPSGCRFHPRCSRASQLCREVEPPLTSYPGNHLAACHYPLNVDATEVSVASRSPLSPLSAGDTKPEVLVHE